MPDRFFEAVGDRLKHPIIGPIIITYIVWNWDLIFYLMFADFSIQERIVHVQNQLLFFTVDGFHRHSVPIIFGFSWSIFSAYILEVTDQIQDHFTKDKRSTRRVRKVKDIEDETKVLEAEGKRKLALDNLQLIEDLTEKIVTLKDDNEELKARVESFNTLQDRYSRQENELALLKEKERLLKEELAAAEDTIAYRVKETKRLARGLVSAVKTAENTLPDTDPVLREALAHSERATSKDLLDLVEKQHKRNKELIGTVEEFSKLLILSLEEVKRGRGEA